MRKEEEIKVFSLNCAYNGNGWSGCVGLGTNTGAEGGQFITEYCGVQGKQLNQTEKKKVEQI